MLYITIIASAIVTFLSIVFSYDSKLAIFLKCDVYVTEWYSCARVQSSLMSANIWVDVSGAVYLFYAVIASWRDRPVFGTRKGRPCICDKWT